ncbi:MAG TPA: beta-galactosidase domain 4-containing protein, partial [Puia sp.]|nr:beta-galactosidase domain 4-containing protein [Puia sp.]
MKPSIPISLTASLLFFCAQAIADTIPPAPKAQPLLTTLISVSPLALRILNDSGLRDYANIVLDWELRANGLVRQKGSLGNLPIPPNRPAMIRLPIRIPPATSEELFLSLHYRYRNKKTVADQQLLLKPWSGSQIP